MEFFQTDAAGQIQAGHRGMLRTRHSGIQRKIGQGGTACNIELGQLVAVGIEGLQLRQSAGVQSCDLVVFAVKNFQLGELGDVQRGQFVLAAVKSFQRRDVPDVQLGQAAVFKC